MTKPIVGNRVRIETNYLRGTETFTARVTWVEKREGGYYYGYAPESPEQGLFGATWEREVRHPSGFGARIVADLGPAVRSEAR